MAEVKKGVGDVVAETEDDVGVAVGREFDEIAVDDIIDDVRARDQLRDTLSRC